MRDRNVLQYIGLPLVNLMSPCVLSGGDHCEGNYTDNKLVNKHRSHQESRSPFTPDVNKVVFDRNLGFVTENTSYLSLPVNLPVNISDPQE